MLPDSLLIEHRRRRQPKVTKSATASKANSQTQSLYFGADSPRSLGGPVLALTNLRLRRPVSKALAATQLEKVEQQPHRPTLKPGSIRILHRPIPQVHRQRAEPKRCRSTFFRHDLDGRRTSIVVVFTPCLARPTVQRAGACIAGCFYRSHARIVENRLHIVVTVHLCML